MGEIGESRDTIFHHFNFTKMTSQECAVASRRDPAGLMSLSEGIVSPRGDIVHYSFRQMGDGSSVGMLSVTFAGGALCSFVVRDGCITSKKLSEKARKVLEAKGQSRGVAMVRVPVRDLLYPQVSSTPRAGDPPVLIFRKGAAFFRNTSGEEDTDNVGPVTIGCDGTTSLRNSPRPPNPRGGVGIG